MHWTKSLSTEQQAQLSRMDNEIAALRVRRYKLQNAATKRAQRETPNGAKKGRGKGKTKTAGRKKKSAKGRSGRTRAGKAAAAVRSERGTNADVGGST